MNNECPCGSGNVYSECCEPYHLGTADAPTAEKLMRSRYSAYAKGVVQYLKDSLHPDKQQSFDLDEARRSMKKVSWTGLTILETKDGLEQDETGEVHFKATYRTKDIPGELEEHSQFEKIDGKWLYVDGTVAEPEVQQQVVSQKVGRNAPCPCGSGKKFKKCCG